MVICSGRTEMSKSKCASYCVLCLWKTEKKNESTSIRDFEDFFFWFQSPFHHESRIFFESSGHFPFRTSFRLRTNSWLGSLPSCIKPCEQKNLFCVSFLWVINCIYINWCAHVPFVDVTASVIYKNETPKKKNTFLGERKKGVTSQKYEVTNEKKIKYQEKKKRFFYCFGLFKRK